MCTILVYAPTKIHFVLVSRLSVHSFVRSFARSQAHSFARLLLLLLLLHANEIFFMRVKNNNRWRIHTSSNQCLITTPQSKHCYFFLSIAQYQHICAWSIWNNSSNDGDQIRINEYNNKINQQYTKKQQQNNQKKINDTQQQQRETPQQHIWYESVFFLCSFSWCIVFGFVRFRRGSGFDNKLICPTSLFSPKKQFIDNKTNRKQNREIIEQSVIAARAKKVKATKFQWCFCVQLLLLVVVEVVFQSV